MTHIAYPSSANTPAGETSGALRPARGRALFRALSFASVLGLLPAAFTWALLARAGGAEPPGNPPASWWQRADGPALLNEFRKRTLSGDDLDRIERLVRKLGDDSFAAREKASADLVAYGPRIAPVLRERSKRAGLDLEQRRRLGRCLRAVLAKEDRPLPPAAARLVALRKPAGAVEALLAFLPWAEDADLADEVQKALAALAVTDGKVHPALLRALGDALPARRAAAAEVVAGAGEAGRRPELRRLLADPHPRVRLCAAVALAGRARDAAAVPALIELASTLPAEQAWHADDVLRRLAGPKAPPPDLAKEPAPRKAYRAAWQAWWKENGAAVDMARAAAPAAARARKPWVRATASKSGKKDTPERAFDGDRKTAWNSAGFAPQWIEADLGAPTELARLVLVVNQHPPGATTHEVWVSDEPIGERRARARRVHTFKGPTRSQQELKLDFPPGLFGRYVQIRTTESEGWVAWMEIELRVGRSRLSFLPGPG